MSDLITGVFAGIVLSIILICVACIQMWPKWKAWGFVRATKAEEFSKIESYQEGFRRKTSGYFWIGGLGFAAYTILTWFVNEDNLIGASISFIIFFVPGYIFACYILDHLTRKKIIKFYD